VTSPSVWPDALDRLTALVNTLENVPGRAVVPVEELRLAIDAWGFLRGDPLAGGRATFHIHERYPHLQTDVYGDTAARSHPSQVAKVVGLIQSLRVLLGPAGS
jgi:hypothetical protein